MIENPFNDQLSFFVHDADLGTPITLWKRNLLNLQNLPSAPGAPQLCRIGLSCRLKGMDPEFSDVFPRFLDNEDIGRLNDHAHEEP